MKMTKQVIRNICTLLAVSTLPCAVVAGETNAASMTNTMNATSLQLRLDELSQAFYLLEYDIDMLDQNQKNSQQAAQQRADLQKQLNKLYFDLVSVQGQLAQIEAETDDETQIAGRGDAVYLPVQTPASSLNLQSSLTSANGLSISGFMDAIYESRATGSAQGQSRLNQVEVDFHHDINSRAHAFLGIWYVEGFQVGYANMMYKLLQADEHSRSALKTWTVAAGQFDAPFGEDINNYSSNVRKTISVPTIVANTHGMWNDVGLQSNLKFSRVSTDAYLVRGFKLQSFVDGEAAEYTPQLTAGGRLNVNLLSSLKVGTSFAQGWLPGGESAMNMSGAHVTFAPTNWQFIVEGLALNEDQSGNAYTTKGYYAQALRQLGRAFAFTRADYSDIDGYNPERFYSIGAGVNLGSGLETRGEYKLDGNHDNHQGLLQVVATF